MSFLVQEKGGRKLESISPPVTRFYNRIKNVFKKNFSVTTKNLNNHFLGEWKIPLEEGFKV